MDARMTITPDEADMILHLVEQGIEDFEARVSSDPRAITERVGLRQKRHDHADALTVAQLLAATVSAAPGEFWVKTGQ